MIKGYITNNSMPFFIQIGRGDQTKKNGQKYLLERKEIVRSEKIRVFPKLFPKYNMCYIIFVILYYSLLFFIVLYYFLSFIIIPTTFNISKSIYQTTNKPNQNTITYHQPLIYWYMIHTTNIINHNQPPIGHNLNKIISPYHYIITSTQHYHHDTTLSA